MTIITLMKNTPKFIKDFSKDQSSDERNTTAQTIKNKRREYFNKKNEQTKNIEKLHGLEVQSEEAKKSFEKKIGEIENLKKEIEKISTSMMNKISNYFLIKKLQSELKIGEKNLEELEINYNGLESKKNNLSIQIKTQEVPKNLKDIEGIINNFYEQQKEKWINSDFLKKDIQKYFSEEFLMSLSMDEYMLLLKRFPKEMVAHVTRQGIRDHTGHMWHTGGNGEYTDSFMKILKDGRLRSPLGVYLIEGMKDEKIIEFLHLNDKKTKGEAFNSLDEIVGYSNKGGSGSYADSMAIHFATEEVADSYYGSERGNEIFIVYPSAYIASQYYFRGQLSEAGGGYRNDQRVWANEEKGVNLNAGIVFVPENTKVDKTTGSRYEIDDNKNPILNQEYVDSIKKLMYDKVFEDFAEEVMETIIELGKIEQMASSRKSQEIIPDIERKITLYRQKMTSFRQILQNKFNINNASLQDVLFDYNNLSMIKYFKYESRDRQIQIEFEKISGCLQKYGLLYKGATNTITAKEFWENYFIEHPEQKLSKIVYYPENDPTKALNNRQIKNNLIKKGNSDDLGFPEHKIDSKDSKANVGLDRFRSIAEKVIENYYQNSDKEAA